MFAYTCVNRWEGLKRLWFATAVGKVSRCLNDFGNQLLQLLLLIFIIILTVILLLSKKHDFIWSKSWCTWHSCLFSPRVATRVVIEFIRSSAVYVRRTESRKTATVSQPLTFLQFRKTKPTSNYSVRIRATHVTVLWNIC